MVGGTVMVSVRVPVGLLGRIRHAAVGVGQTATGFLLAAAAGELERLGVPGDVPAGVNVSKPAARAARVKGERPGPSATRLVAETTTWTCRRCGHAVTDHWVKGCRAGCACVRFLGGGADADSQGASGAGADADHGRVGVGLQESPAGASAAVGGAARSGGGGGGGGTGSDATPGEAAVGIDELF